jgi:probable HAF family extracellular repeat protein
VRAIKALRLAAKTSGPHSKFPWPAAAIAATALAIAGSARATEYQITDLGIFGGASSIAGQFASVNASGQVVGYYTDQPYDVTGHAFRSDANGGAPAVSNLGSIGGSRSTAAAVNDLGQAVGGAITSDGRRTHAFRTTPNGSITPAADLGTLGGTIDFGQFGGIIDRSEAFGVNVLGQAVGSSLAPAATSAVTRAFRTAPNANITPASDLGTLGGRESEAFAINASGQTVGDADLTAASSPYHAFRSAPNGLVAPLTDLGTLGGPNSAAHGVNDAGQAVGVADTATSGVHHAFRTAPNGAITAASDLGTLGGSYSIARSINSLGQTVGFQTTRETSVPSHFSRTLPARCRT